MIVHMDDLKQRNHVTGQAPKHIVILYEELEDMPCQHFFSISNNIQSATIVEMQLSLKFIFTLFS